MQELANKISFAYDGLDDAFPPCDPGIKPFGQRVMVQIRTPKSVTKGGIHLPAGARETELYNTQVAKVLELGPLAFHSRSTMEMWPEGEWCQPGDFVRVPLYGGDRWTVKTKDGNDEAIVVIFKDLDLVGKVTGDPLAIKAFL